MKFLLEQGEFPRGRIYWRVVVNYNGYETKMFHKWLWWNQFTDHMDSRYIYPFDFRRLSSWEKETGKVRTWIAYVSVPDRFLED